MAYFAYRESGDNVLPSTDDAHDPMSSSIAGTKNIARGVQPSMFNLLSWGDDGRAVNDTAGGSQRKPQPKQVAEDRWQSESQFQYCRVGSNKKKTNSKQPSATSGTGVENSKPAPQSNNIATDNFKEVNPEKNVSSSNWKPRKIIAKKQRQLRTAKKRHDLETLRSSRGVADSAIAEVYERPAFHNYGRCSMVNPWVPRAEGLHTCNAQSKTKNGVPMNRHAEIKVSRASSPVPRAVTPASPQKTSPRQAKQVVTSPIRQATPTLDEPPRPVSPVTAVVPPPAPLRVKMGSSKHVRAPRVVRAPSRALPASLAGLSARQVNDPKSYRCLNPDWTGIIKPAGTVNPRGESVSECLHLFL